MHRKTPFICECGWIRTNLMFKTGYSRSPCQSDYTLINSISNLQVILNPYLFSNNLSISLHLINSSSVGYSFFSTLFSNPSTNNIIPIHAIYIDLSLFLVTHLWIIPFNHFNFCDIFFTLLNHSIA